MTKKQQKCYCIHLRCTYVTLMRIIQCILTETLLFRVISDITSLCPKDFFNDKFKKTQTLTVKVNKVLVNFLLVEKNRKGPNT